MSDDLGGWGPKAWDLLEKRVDAIRADLNALMGRPRNDNGGSDKTRFLGIGVTTWIAFLGTVIVPLATTALIVIGHQP